MPVVLPKPEDLVDRLAAFKSLAAVPREELAWMAAAGECRRYAQGEVLMPKGEIAHELLVMLSGRLRVAVDQGTGHRYIVDNPAGSLTGLYPYSRLTHALADIVMEDESDTLTINRDRFPELIRECPVLTTTLVHAMLDRARQYTGLGWQNEKLLSLGRLAGGLAHELDNPASAGARCAKLLGRALGELNAAGFAFGAAQPTPDQRNLVLGLIDESRNRETADTLSPLERSSHEDTLADWLATRQIDSAAAPPLADRGLTIADLDQLACALSGALLESALRWIAAASTVQELATDIEHAAVRVHDLVSAVKRFSYVDRAGAAEPTDITQGLRDTVELLAAKAREKSVRVSLDVASDLPAVSANTAALNQVWENLIENALDAAPQSGEVSIAAAHNDAAVVVRVIDDGPGITLDVQERMFDPFFTTKKVGEGTGLGLDIARRVVLGLEGQIEVETRPGHTEFRVTLPFGEPRPHFATVSDASTSPTR
jgi:signal transduction histidine kinase